MKNLNELFSQDNQNTQLSTVYKGEIIHLYDHVYFKEGDKLAIKILSTKSPHKQSIGLMVIEPKYKKLLRANGIENAGFYLWEDTLPKEGIEIEVLKDITVSIWNGWKEEGESRVMKASKNAAMKIVVKENIRTYHCNDGDIDEDFDDLIFEISVISKE